MYQRRGWNEVPPGVEELLLVQYVTAVTDMDSKVH